MESLSKSEEQLMEFIWQRGKVFMKELMDMHPEPKPAATTLATLLKRMQNKKYVGYEKLGNSRQYYPLVDKTDYFSRRLKSMIQNFFNDSPSQFASFFTRETDLSDKELTELKKVVDEQVNLRKK
jgi:predicted transcriptional regulator